MALRYDLASENELQEDHGFFVSGQGMARLSFHGVSHAYDDNQALSGIDLEVGSGEIVCLVGPSGCGKTTALRLAAGLERLQKGEIRIDGRLVAGPGISLAPEVRGVGLVFQDFALFPHMTVADNVAFGLRGEGRAGRRAVVGDLLAMVGLEHYADKYPHMLSGGEQQRVALARALAPRPAIVLLDEPFSGLDVRLREDVREQTLTILREVGASALVVTHDAEEAMYMGDRIAVLQKGRLVQVGEPAHVYRHPESAFVARFLGEVNWLHGVMRSDCADSPIGRVPMSGIAEGERVDVLIRPEGLHLCTDPASEGLSAVVLGSRLLGHSSLVRLKLDDGSEIRARIAGNTMPAVGSDVHLRAERDAIYIFPCRGEAARQVSTAT